MKLRHAAALALVGWYLMVPPMPGEQEVLPPISQWTQAYSFDSAAACQAVLNAGEDNAAKTLKHKFGVSTDFAGLMAALKSTHDPNQIKQLSVAAQQFSIV